jgi:hypothetical protein
VPVPFSFGFHTTREPLTLTWVWPGLPATRPRGRPPASAALVVDPTWIAAGEAAAATSRMPGLAEDLFLYTFLERAGAKVPALRLQGLRAGAAWAPTKHARLNGLLRAWVAREVGEISGDERVVVPVVAWERRSRRDRARLLPPPETTAAPNVEIDPAEPAARMARALKHLDAANAEADAILSRVAAAFQKEKRTDT